MNHCKIVEQELSENNPDLFQLPFFKIN